MEKKEEQAKTKKQQKEERKQQYLKDEERKENEEELKASQAQKNPFSVIQNDEENVMEEDTVIFTDSFSNDHLPKGTLSRLPIIWMMEGFNLTIILISLLILLSSMDFKHKIIQWNCRGLKPNYNEVPLLISEYNPSVFYFQETFLKPDDNISLKAFDIYNYVHTNCLSLLVIPQYL